MTKLTTLKRDRFLEQLGLIVLRFDNDFVNKYSEEVIKFVKDLLEKRKDYKVSNWYQTNGIRARRI